MDTRTRKPAEVRERRWRRRLQVEPLEDRRVLAFSLPGLAEFPSAGSDAFRAESRFADVAGQGDAVVVLDSGLNTTHPHPFFGDFSFFPAAWRDQSGLGDGSESEGSSVLTGSDFTFSPDGTPFDEDRGVDDWRLMAAGEAAGVFSAGASSVGVQAVAVQTPSPSNSKELPSGLESVARGSTYFVEIWVQDRVEPGVGISGGTVDVNYLTTLVQAVGIVNLDFQLFPAGSIDSAGGVVRSLGGGMLQTGLGVAPQWARLAYVEILAASSGEAQFELGPGSSQFSRYGQGNVVWDLVDLGSPTVVRQIGGHWQNPNHPCDVNDDGLITPLDALIAINEINLHDIRELPVPGPTSQGPPPYFDVSGDDWLTAQDVLLVVNYLNSKGAGPIPAGSASAALAAMAGAIDSSLAEGEPPPDPGTQIRVPDSWLLGDVQPARREFANETDVRPEAGDAEDSRFQAELQYCLPGEMSNTATAGRTYDASPHAQPLEDLLTLLADRLSERSLDDALA